MAGGDDRLERHQDEHDIATFREIQAIRSKVPSTEQAN